MMRNGEKEKEKKRRKWMKGVIETWDVRNDSGITMRTINKEKREINIERGQERERDRATRGEVIRLCLFENVLDCLSIE